MRAVRQLAVRGDDTAMNFPLQIDRTAPVPLQDQLFEQLRQLILTGRLKPNTRIIATRFLAEHAGVSRRTVLFAYERLIAEGYLETRPAIGTFVSTSLPDGAKPPLNCFSPLDDIPRQSELFPPAFEWERAKPAIAETMPEQLSAMLPGDSLSSKVWLRCMRDVLDTYPEIYAHAVPTAGVESLRRGVADYLASTRGILASPDQIIVVSGRRHACSLVAHLFQRQGDRVIVERPSNPAIDAFFRTRGDVVGVPVDEHGIQVDQLPSGQATLIYVTPTRQDPLGASMPPSRRARLIEWARGAGAYIIEDDCDSELRYQGVAHSPIITLDPYGLVFYIGSFASVLGDGLSLGYLVAPPEYVAPLIRIKSLGGEGGQGFEQSVVAHLLASGEYDHQLRRIRKNYLDRRDVLVSALKYHFGAVDLMGTVTGTRLTWVLPPDFPDALTVSAMAQSIGLHVRAVADPLFSDCPFNNRAAIVEFGATSAERLREGVAMWARALKPLAHNTPGMNPRCA